MDLKKYTNEIIIPTLKRFDLYSENAVKLLQMTVVHESGGFKWIRQTGYSMTSSGGAFGYPQIEHSTHDSLWDNQIRYREELCNKLIKAYDPQPHLTGEDTAKRYLDRKQYESLQPSLLTNQRYALIIARIRYLPAPALPDKDDLLGMAKYWLEYYNRGGKGTVEKFLKDWELYGTD